MKLKTTALILIMSLAFVPLAQAAPPPGPPPGHPGMGPGFPPGPGPRPGPPPRPYHGWGHFPPPRPYYRGYRYWDNNDVWIGLGVGLLASILIANGNAAANERREQEQREYELKMQGYRDSTRDEAETEAGRAVQLIAEKGLGEAIREIERSWSGDGKRTFLDDRKGAKLLKVSGFAENKRMEYAFNEESGRVTVRVIEPAYSISEEKSSYYTEPQPVSSVMGHIGFELADDMRAPTGHLLIREVARGTVAAYAGITAGDVLVEIDSYDTKAYNAERINAYIANRGRAKALTKVTFSHKGIQKTVEIQL